MAQYADYMETDSDGKLNPRVYKEGGVMDGGCPP